MKRLTKHISLWLIAAILVMLNLVGTQWFGRLDLTDDKVYSLSAASIKMVERLKDPLTVKAYFTDNLPAPYSSNRRFVQDKLNEYRAYSSKFQYAVIDPNSEKLKSDAEESGIQAVQVQSVENDEVQIKNAFMGVVLEYGGKKETIPVVQDLSGLEYDITTAIRKLTSKQLPSIGFLTGHGEPEPDKSMQMLKSALDKSYEVKSITADSSGQFFDKPDVLLVIAPADSLPQPAIRALDDYISSGGKVGFWLNHVKANLQEGEAEVNNTGLDALLKHEGIYLRDDLVMDKQSAPLTIQNNGVVRQFPYPFLPIATQFGAHPITAGVREMLFAFVSSIDITKVSSAKSSSGIKVTPLVSSGTFSQTQSGTFSIKPDPEMPIKALRGGPYTLAAAYEGTFSSLFDPPKTSKPTRLVVVGDGDFIDEGVVGDLPEGNVTFAMNAIDWLLQDETLASIRLKNIQPPVLGSLPEGAKAFLKYFVMLFPPLLVILFGLMRWRRRRMKE
jgi:gliding-associated putative ABC transporter substrate-binding component GldG